MECILLLVLGQLIFFFIPALQTHTCSNLCKHVDMFKSVRVVLVPEVKHAYTCFLALMVVGSCL